MRYYSTLPVILLLLLLFRATRKRRSDVERVRRNNAQ